MEKTLLPIGAVWGFVYGKGLQINESANPMVDIQHWFQSEETKDVLSTINQMSINSSTAFLILININTLDFLREYISKHEVKECNLQLLISIIVNDTINVVTDEAIPDGYIYFENTKTQNIIQAFVL